MEQRARGPLGFVEARDLARFFGGQNPFDRDLSLKPEEGRFSVLAANANFPYEMQVGAFMASCSAEGGSPIILQFSGSSLALAGSALLSPGGPSEDRASRLDALRLGSRLARAVANVYLEMYRPPYVALGLDHFAVPDLRDVLSSDGCRSDDVAARRRAEEARRALKEASLVAASSGVAIAPAEDTVAWETYLCSAQYLEALEGFMTVIREFKPAWAMIDTEELPPVLNFAITKQVSDLVKGEYPDVMLEAEYGATGQAGDHKGYTKLSGGELKSFAEEVAGFVKYTGAQGISYPIGMEHASPSDRKHEPDVLRLETVQREILKANGSYVPFAQHGGTGAGSIARGLVGKNNVSTHFLVTAARSVAAHVERNREGISLGKKSASGPSMYVDAARAIADECSKKLKECGTYGYFGGGR